LSQESVGGNDELGFSVAAHAIDSAGGTSSDRVGVAARVLCGNGNRAIRAADDRTIVIEGVSVPKSTTKPVFFEPLIKVTVVPTFKQNALLDLASGKSGVAVA
jgi:hypothetical protein